MKHSLCIILLSLFFMGNATACHCDAIIAHSEDNHNPSQMGNKVTIRINSKTFTAVLDDNPTAKAFEARLPMTIDMIELNGDEKYHDLPENLPTNASRPKTIQAGDLMLFGSRTLVLFYQTFSTTYRYTRLGHIDDVSGLATALGPKNVTVRFEKE